MDIFKSRSNRLFVSMPRNIANVGSAPCMRVMCEVMPEQLPAQQLNWADGPIEFCFVAVGAEYDLGGEETISGAGVSFNSPSGVPDSGVIPQTVPPYVMFSAATVDGYFTSIEIEFPAAYEPTTATFELTTGGVVVMSGEASKAEEGDHWLYVIYEGQEDHYVMLAGETYCVTITTTPAV